MDTPLHVWIQAARPKTLPAAAAPVLIGTAMAYADGELHVIAAAAACVSALLIQIGTNFHNDYADFERGVDQAGRKGPTRVTQAGLVAPDRMRRATGAVFAAAVLVGAYLIGRGGWPIALIGAASVGSALWYSASSVSLAQTGWADLFVVAFFGPVAVGGTYYVQALELPLLVPVVGLGPGLIATAILAVNNLRDVEEDRIAGKRTLAVRFGPTFARIEYVGCLSAALLIPVVVPILPAGGGRSALGGVLVLGALVPAIPGVRTVLNRRSGPALNRALARTGQVLLVYSVLFAIGWNL